MTAYDADVTSVYDRQGFGKRLGFGRSAAMVVIDFQVGFTDATVLGGGNIAEALENTRRLLAVARERRIPIAFTRHVYAADGSDAGLFNRKLSSNNLLAHDSELSQIAPPVAPAKDELVLTKRYPSAFFATDFASWLTLRGVDTLIITGCTTSGCVRASTVDAMCSGFRPMVVRECVGDRAEGPHEASLFDLDQKYADVISSNEAVANLHNIVESPAA